MLLLPAIASVLLAGFSSSAAVTAPKEPQDTTLGQRVTDYVAAFNSGDTTTIRNFLENNFTREMLTRVPVARRLDRFKSMRETLGTLTLQGVSETGPGSITATVTSSREGTLTCIFEAENRPPYRLTGIRVEHPDGPGEAGAAPALSDSGLIAAAQAMLDSLIRADRFSGVVLIAKNDSVLMERAAGFADRGKRIPNTPETRFNVGSISKSFTRLAIHQLQAAGKLSFSDTIGKFLPGYPNAEAASTVTIHHLLEMTSGTPDFFGDRFDRAQKEHLRTLGDYLPLFADKPLEFTPGSATRYSNGGYLVLGLIIEAITGTDYYTYVRDNIFAPAGMSASGWFEKSDPREDMARGYTSGGKNSNERLLPQKGSSAGGGYSTVHDLLRYTRALRNGTLVLPDSERGLGIAGGAPGLNAALEMDARSGYVIVVLSNLDPPSAESVARAIRLSLPRR